MARAPPIHSAEQLAITPGRIALEEGKQWGDGSSKTLLDGNASSALNAAYWQRLRTVCKRQPIGGMAAMVMVILFLHFVVLWTVWAR